MGRGTRESGRLRQVAADSDWSSGQFLAISRAFAPECLEGTGGAVQQIEMSAAACSAFSASRDVGRYNRAASPAQEPSKWPFRERKPPA